VHALQGQRALPLQRAAQAADHASSGWHAAWCRL